MLSTSSWVLLAAKASANVVAFPMGVVKDDVMGRGCQ